MTGIEYGARSPLRTERRLGKNEMRSPACSSRMAHTTGVEPAPSRQTTGRPTIRRRVQIGGTCRSRTLPVRAPAVFRTACAPPRRHVPLETTAGVKSAHRSFADYRVPVSPRRHGALGEVRTHTQHVRSVPLGPSSCERMVTCAVRIERTCSDLEDRGLSTQPRADWSRSSESNRRLRFTKPQLCP